MPQLGISECDILLNPHSHICCRLSKEKSEQGFLTQKTTSELRGIHWQCLIISLRRLRNLFRSTAFPKCFGIDIPKRKTRFSALL